MAVFGNIEWKDFFGRLYTKVEQTDLFSRAASVAFYFSFALFPLLLFLITLAGIVLESTESLKRDLYRYLFQIMPMSAFSLVRRTLDEVIESSSGGKLTLGLFITLWSASAGVDTLRTALNAIYQLPESRAWWRTKLQSLILTLLFIALLTIAMITVSTGWEMLERIMTLAGMTIDSPVLLALAQWALILLILLFTSEVIYSWLPCHPRFQWFWFTPGSIVAILLWILFSGLFRLYLHYFNTYNRAYGSLGAVIILMLWMFLSGTSILIGGAINSVLADMKESNNEGSLSADDQEGVSDEKEAKSSEGCD